MFAKTKMPACDMCGREERLVLAEVDGADLSLCPNCVKFGKVKGRNNFSKRNFSKFKKEKKDEGDFRVIKNFPNLIKSVRESKEMTQEEFAKLINEKESILVKWEHGTMRPRIGIAKRLERLLKVKLVEEDVKVSFESKDKKKRNDTFTLGDMIKVRKRI